jgi:uncharacterized protein (DUF1800 family)
MKRTLHRLAALLLAAMLAACGGGAGSGSDDPTAGNPAVVEKPATRAAAMRFLAQATFGPTEADITRVMTIGYGPWIDEQFARPPSEHRAAWDAADAAIKARDATRSAGTREVLDSFYTRAVSGDDQLRQRVAFALSQVFVVSMAQDNVGNEPRGVAGYLDMLGTTGLTNYRALIEQVARHPVMGLYLSHLRNQKEDAASGRVPDENFAREVMQLFSIGLHTLNADGSVVADAGTPRATYTHDDIAGLAKVFTGFSWAGPDTADGRFWGWSQYRDADRTWRPMQGYAKFHSTSEKRFLGRVVPAQTAADPDASLRAALDALAAHPNVGPFIARQLIQRLVTSHPSPAYVARVAAVFADNGSGQRGDMKAVVRAVLLDREARDDAAAAADAGFGKLREPVLRLTAVLRAFGAQSDSGAWLIGATDDPGGALGQSPLRSPSVFNFWRPGYVAPGSESGAQGRTAPELQLTHETTVAGYANYLRSGLQSGFGQRGIDWTAPRPDVQLALTAEMALADRPAELVDHVAAKLLGGAANGAWRAEALAAVESVTLPALRPDLTNQTQHDNARRNRARIAVFLAAVAPEFLLQK